MKIHFAFLLTAMITGALSSTSTYAQSSNSEGDLADGALRALEQDVHSGEYGNIHSVIVIHRGELKAEWYFRGADERRGMPLGVVDFDPETLHDLRSVTKSIVSLLFGIAVADGTVPSVDDTLASHFQDYSDELRPAHSRIRLHDLLSMTSGIRWDERTYPYTDRRNSETAMDRADDRIRLILSESIDAPPGERFNYSGGDVELIARIIARATGTPLEIYARDELFAPLGIDEFEWLTYPDGLPIAASGLRLLPLDMAKIGQLVLQRGRWGDRQVVPAGWIDESTTFKSQASEDRRCGTQYGYYWWLRAICDGESTVGLVNADGNGGQLILIAPDLDLVVVTTAGFYNRGGPVYELVLAIVAAVSG